MSIKTILVPFGEGRDNTALLDAAFLVARRFDAHVEALYVYRRPSDPLNMVIPDSWRVSDSTMQSVLEAARRGSEAALARAREAFEDYCTNRQISVVEGPPPRGGVSGGVSAGWRSMMGQESIVVAHLGRLADLIVVGRPEEKTPAPEMLEAALMETRRPLLVVPPTPLPTSLGSRIAIGWNGSAEAAGAIAAAMPFLSEADAVDVLTTRSDRVGVDSDELVRYLAWHGIAGTVHIFDPGSRSTGTAILAEAESRRSDLLVLGGYSHSRRREVILGGVTRDVLATSRIPILMSH